VIIQLEDIYVRRGIRSQRSDVPKLLRIRTIRLSAVPGISEPVRPLLRNDLYLLARR